MKSTKKRWQWKTLIEILPVLIALTIFFSYRTIRGVTDIPLFTPLMTVVDQVPGWVVLLMVLIAFVGFTGMMWLIFLFTRSALMGEGEE